MGRDWCDRQSWKIAKMSTNPNPGCCQESTGAASGGTGIAKYLPTWLCGRRGLILGVVVLIGGGTALGWPWLLALGVAPILLSLLPCAAMCALGLCMGLRGSSPASDAAAGKRAPAAHELLDRTRDNALRPSAAREREPAIFS